MSLIFIWLYAYLILRTNITEMCNKGRNQPHGLKTQRRKVTPLRFSGWTTKYSRLITWHYHHRISLHKNLCRPWPQLNLSHEALKHPTQAHSPDLLPCYSHVFGLLITALKGCTFWWQHARVWGSGVSSTARNSLKNLTFRGLCIMIYSYNKNQQHALFLNCNVVKNCTCFGQTYCPSSGVLILCSQQLVFVILITLTVCYRGRDGTLMWQLTKCLWCLFLTAAIPLPWSPSNGSHLYMEAHPGTQHYS
jgi:hypothetical protein